MTIKLIVGLGNIGKTYQYNRHNYGFLLLDHISTQQSTSFKNNQNIRAKHYKTIINNNTVHFIKPESFINNSGLSVLKALQYYNINTDELLVCYDDLDIAFGALQFKFSGSSAGHNGLKDIMHHLGKQFYRLRLGIGCETKKDASDFVLSNFSKQQQVILPKLFDKINTILPDIINLKLEKVKHYLHTNDIL